MEKQKFMSFWLMLLLVMCIVFITGWIREKPFEDKEEIAWESEYPEEYIIYRDYIETIKDVTSFFMRSIFDTEIVEATVISITKSQVCPEMTNPSALESKKCSLEPYPKDIGVVRIDKIIDYITFFKYGAEQLFEQSSIEEPIRKGKTTAGYKGKELHKSKLPEYKPLQVGQKVSVSFLLTARAAKVRYVSVPPISESKQSEQPHGRSEGTISLKDTDYKQTVTYPIKPADKLLPKTYKPIPKEGNYFVFTTRIIEYPKTSQKILSGLKVGDKFRAQINYDGILYVEEYEIIN
ncbi:hypothetical protein KAU39_03880 [bacterium]|nr:hypothetical protein [bacterium]